MGTLLDVCWFAHLWHQVTSTCLHAMRHKPWSQIAQDLNSLLCTMNRGAIFFFKWHRGEQEKIRVVLLYMTFLDFDSLLWVAQPINTKQEKINHLPGVLVGNFPLCNHTRVSKINLKFAYINGLSHKIVNRIYLSFKLTFNRILYLSFENSVNIRKASWSYSPLPLPSHLQHFLVLSPRLPHFF